MEWLTYILIDFIFKPKKPVLPESSKPKTESTVDPNVVKKLQDQINVLKDSLESITKKLTEHIEKSEKHEKRFEKMEKNMIGEIEDLTKELDEEKKARSGVDIEVKRLTKLIKNQQVSWKKYVKRKNEKYLDKTILMASHELDIFSDRSDL